MASDTITALDLPVSADCIIIDSLYFADMHYILLSTSRAPFSESRTPVVFPHILSGDFQFPSDIPDDLSIFIL